MRVTSLDSCDCFISEQVIPKVREPRRWPASDRRARDLPLHRARSVAVPLLSASGVPVLRQRRPRRSAVRIPTM